MVGVGRQAGRGTQQYRCALASTLLALLVAPSLAAQQPEPAPLPELGEHLKALAAEKLLPLEGASVDELAALVGKGEKLYLAQRYDEAAVVLLEAVESPRYADFQDFEPAAAAEHMLGAALHRTGSLLTARRYLQRGIQRGSDSSYFGPAVRRYVDVALDLGDADAAADWLEELGQTLPEDAQNELRYLRGRARYDAGELAQAGAIFGQIGKRSRFFASARYLMGVAAARGERYAEAEKRFCEIADTGADDRYSFFVDDRFFKVQDLARLGLGRVAHEMGRSDDAFYYYFQLPQDSPKLADAFFEGAYAAYEGGDHGTAVDLLDQLEARFPRSPFVDEATILRGYVSLGRCEFERADALFARFTKRFGPITEEIDRLLGNRARRDGLYEELLEAEQGRSPRSEHRRMILALLRVDPEFYRLHAHVRALDAEAARAGRVHRDLDMILAKLQGSERPRAIDEDAQGHAELRRELKLARRALRAASREVDAVRRAGADKAKVRDAERRIAQLADRVENLSDRAYDLRSETRARTGSAETGGSGAEALIARDVERASRLPARASAVRVKLAAAAERRAHVALRELRDRLGMWLRRARIGRIDAVMGSKRRIEIQIESLAAGRFPPELRNPLMVQGLLEDDEEYWPFEGEDWPDEYEERLPEGEEDAE